MVAIVLISILKFFIVCLKRHIKEVCKVSVEWKKFNMGLESLKGVSNSNGSVFESVAYEITLVPVLRTHKGP